MNKNDLSSIDFLDTPVFQVGNVTALPFIFIFLGSASKKLKHIS